MRFQALRLCLTSTPPAFDSLAINTPSLSLTMLFFTSESTLVSAPPDFSPARAGLRLPLPAVHGKAACVLLALGCRLPRLFFPALEGYCHWWCRFLRDSTLTHALARRRPYSALVPPSFLPLSERRLLLLNVAGSANLARDSSGCEGR